MNKNIVKNNFDGDKTLTSYDEKKVWVIEDGSNSIFCKKSSMNELNTNLIFSEKLKNESIVVDNQKYKLNIPNIYDFNEFDGILKMEFCKGVNLEFLLRNKKTYKLGMKILNSLLKYMLDNNLQWIDFAPRNVLIDGNNLNLVDFEKGINNTDIFGYLRNHVYEEYGSFMLPEDRMYMPDEVFDINKNSSIIHFIKDIGPKRIKAVADILGYKDFLTEYEYLQIIKTFIIAEIPIKQSNDYVFPRVYLEQILKDKMVNPQAFYNYGNEVLKINEERGNSFVKRRDNHV